MSEDEATTQTQLLLVFFQNLHIFFIIHESFHLGKISSSRFSEAQCSLA